MKKIIILILLLFIGLAGCVNENEKKPQDNINKIEVDNVMILIDLLPNPITEKDREEVESVKLRYDALKAEEKALITNYEVLASAIEYFRIIDETIEQTNQMFESLQAYYEDYIPDELTDDIELPTKHETDMGDVQIVWNSKDYNTLTNKGQIIPGRKDITVSLETTFILKNTRYSFTQNVKVKGISFDPLPERRLAVGYVTSGSFKGLSETALKTLDVVNYAFATVTDDGKVSVLSLANLEKMLNVRRQGIRVLLCIGGYGKNAVNFSKAARTQQGRIAFAMSIVEAINKYHFDGVDIDWEYPGFYENANYSISLTEDKANYNLLMAEIKRQVKAANKDYIVSAALPGGVNFPNNYNLEGLNNVFDYINLMTYDLDDPKTSTHVASLYSSNYSTASTVHQSVTYYINHGISASKLVIGAAFYGRYFNLENVGSIMKAKASSSGSISFSNVYKNYLSKTDGSVETYWDDTAKAPYLYNKNTNVTIAYEDARSIQAKAQYVINNNLMGIMFWEYNQDYNDILMTSIYDNLVKNR